MVAGKSNPQKLDDPTIPSSAERRTSSASASESPPRRYFANAQAQAPNHRGFPGTWTCEVEQWDVNHRWTCLETSGWWGGVVTWGQVHGRTQNAGNLPDLGDKCHPMTPLLSSSCYSALQVLTLEGKRLVQL